MLDENYIKQSAEKLLLSISEEKNFFIKKSMDLHIDAIRQGRNLVRDVVSLSAIIVAFVIPLLLSTDIILNKIALLISVVCFTILILYGVLLLLFVIKKELDRIPKNSEEMIAKTNKDVELIVKIIQNPTKENYFKSIEELMIRHSKKEKGEEGWWKKLFNHDTGFYGLFVLGFIFLIISIFYPIILKLWPIQ